MQRKPKNSQNVSPAGNNSRVKGKTDKKLNKKAKVLIIVGAVVVAIIALALGAYFYTFGKVTHVELNEADLGIETRPAKETESTVNKDEKTINASSETETEEEVVEIKNIAVFGLSVSEVGGIDTNRSDVIMIVSLDEAANRISLISILRDTCAPIEGHDPQKINAAYKYGGPTLAIKTLNQNFHLDISDYITYSAENVEEIVDYLGGVEIDLTQDEINSGGLYNCSPGVNLLSGEEAVKYSRIRYIDSDYYRASRQQTVLFAMLKKVKELPTSSYPELISMFLGCTETSLEFGDLLNYALAFNLQTVNVVTNTVPDSNYETDSWGGISEDTGEWLYIYDLEAASERIHRIIYERSQHGVD